MSLQGYNQAIFFDDRVVIYDKETGDTSIEGVVNKNGLAMEFQANIKVLSGGDRYLVRSVSYTIVGSPTSDSATISDNDLANGLMGIIQAGSVMASNIAACSKGVLVGFFAKLGKYRQDEMPASIPTGDNSWASLILSNNRYSGYGMDPCTKNDEFPAVPASAQIRIPWFRDDISRQDVKDSLDNWALTVNGFKYSLGQVRFRDDNKVDMVCMRVDSLHHLKVAEYSRNLGGLLNNNDTTLGIQDDKVLSEKVNTMIFDTSDDDGVITPSGETPEP